MSNNVVLFPRAPHSTIITTTEQMASAISNMRENYIDHLVDDIAESILFRAHIEGIELSHDKCTKQFAFAIESLKAALLKAVDIDHFLQDTADQVVTFESLEDPLSDTEEQ